MHVMPPMDHSKAVAELGWDPAPTPDSIVEAAQFFLTSRRRSQDRPATD